MERTWTQLLENGITSLMTLKVLLYFHDHAPLMVTKQGLSEQLHSNPAAISAAVADLEKAGVLKRVELGGGRYELYALTEDPAIRQQVRDLAWQFLYQPTTRQYLIRTVAQRQMQRPSGPSLPFSLAA